MKTFRELSEIKQAIDPGEYDDMSLVEVLARLEATVERIAQELEGERDQ